MKLVYLYAKINRNQKDGDINLDSNIRFSFNGDYLEVRDGATLPDGFFSVAGCPRTVVDSVSAIVGENGSGKTSIARCIAEILSGRNSVRKFIAIFLIDGEYVAVYNEKYIKESVFSRIGNLIPKERRYARAEFAASFLYISPHFTPEPAITSDDKRVFDYSTTGLMRDRRNVWHGMWRPQNYSANEYLRALSVIAAYSQVGDSPTEPAEILSRSGIAIKIRRSALGLQSYSTASLRHREELGRTSFDRFCKAYNSISCAGGKGRESFSAKLIKAFILSCVKKRSANGAQAQDVVLDRLANVCTRLSGSDYNQGDRIVDYELITDLYRAMGPENESVVKGFHRMMDGVGELVGTGFVEVGKDTLDVYPESIECVMIPLMKFVEGYADCVNEYDFLQFSFSPPLSSGEMAFLGLWGRLYQFFRTRESNGTEPYHAIVYLDESETALHPEWQRKLVWYTIWFMENFARNAKAHIIYATHSPILLSDIPIGNVHFLKGVHDHKFRQREDLRRLHNTFAANVYDLYRLSFFMQEGTMGKFAYDKVNGLIKGTASLGSKAREDQISLIGDKMIRRYLQNKYAIEDSTRD